MGEADNLFGDAHGRRYQETGGKVGHMWRRGRRSLLLLTTSGRWIPATSTGDDPSHLCAGWPARYVIIASKGGAPDHPGWYKNLAKTPEVTVQVEADVFEARARTATGEERERLWQKANAVARPRPLDYAKRTTREIPVGVLERVATSLRLQRLSRTVRCAPPPAAWRRRRGVARRTSYSPGSGWASPASGSTKKLRDKVASRPSKLGTSASSS